MTSATTKLPFAHEQGERGGDKQRICLERLSDAFPTSHLRNQSVDCSRIPSASRTLKEKYAGDAKESLPSSMKERAEENETVGTSARWGEGGRGRAGVREREKGGMVFVNPSTSGFY